MLYCYCSGSRMKYFALSLPFSSKPGLPQPSPYAQYHYIFSGRANTSYPLWHYITKSSEMFALFNTLVSSTIQCYENSSTALMVIIIFIIIMVKSCETYRSVGVGGRCNPYILVCGCGAIIWRVQPRCTGRLSSRWTGTLTDRQWLPCRRWFSCRRSCRRCLWRWHPAYQGWRSTHSRLLWSSCLRNLRQPRPFHRDIGRTTSASCGPVLGSHRRRPLIGRRIAGRLPRSPRTGHGSHLKLLLRVVCNIRRFGIIWLARQRCDIVGGFRLEVKCNESICNQILHRIEAFLPDIVLVVVIQLEILCDSVKSTTNSQNRRRPYHSAHSAKINYRQLKFYI